jgi:S-adenosylmethionine:tRNA ribosyltransferase-isomerase
MEASREEAFVYALDEYHYELPADLIAQIPCQKRETSRLLVMDRSRGGLEHRCFADLLDYLVAGDVLVVNDTRVVPARLAGVKESGGRVELLVLDPYKDPELGAREGYQCLIKASKRSKPHCRIQLQGDAGAEVLTALEDGKARVRFETPGSLLEMLDRVGSVPLPPYISRKGAEQPPDDHLAYQTVYAEKPGAVAAPTAGLHFSKDLLGKVVDKGIELVSVTLHVGYGTFSPIRVKDLREHRMHPEYVEVSAESAGRIEKARAEGRRIVAVGTTVVRTLEWVASRLGRLAPFQGHCDHYIYPGYPFRVVDAMITNFHLPQSTLILLVSAFAGREAVLGAYREAIRQRYRFFSYGDAMLIL